MLKIALILSVACTLVSVSAQSQAPEWGQCGGQGWAGPTMCPPGWICIPANIYISQCLRAVSTTMSTATGQCQQRFATRTSVGGGAVVASATPA
ncbi:hypothetical protein BDZ94DRAFT_1252860 [Collybia nuda]|uniref:CBM1 domain-containing protein n=1 Tax=Collybia nuda TaxID=64659 RepID=A0A9P5YC03_9AGAR|nr:hypothetical protein BDZ94DRAFT_1252860 [Collybia nuda]